MPGLDQARPDGVAGELVPVARTELLRQAGSVALHGPDAGDKESGDLLRRAALGDEPEDLFFTPGDRLARKGLAPVDEIQVMADQRGLRARVEERPVAHGSPAGVHQIAVGNRFEDVPAGAVPEGLEETARCRAWSGTGS